MKHRCILLLVALLLSTAALYSQQTPYKGTKHYQRMVARFEHAHDIDSTTIVMLGNSLTEFGKDWNRRLEAQNVVNYGIMGDNTVGISARLRQILPYKPKAIFLMCGINDVSPKRSATQVYERCLQVIEQIRRDAPNTTLFVQSLLPINEAVRTWRPLRHQTHKIAQINKLLSRYCRENGIVFIDIFPHLVGKQTNVMNSRYTQDGLHVNEAGYAVWAQVLKPFVLSLNNQPPRDSFWKKQAQALSPLL